MTSLATTVSTPVPVQRRRTRATLLTAAAVAAACALVDLLALPSSGSHLSTIADYAFTALLFPFVLAMIAVITMLHRMQDGQDGRLGKPGVDRPLRRARRVHPLRNRLPGHRERASARPGLHPRHPRLARRAHPVRDRVIPRPGPPALGRSPAAARLAARRPARHRRSPRRDADPGGRVHRDRTDPARPRILSPGASRDPLSSREGLSHHALRAGPVRAVTHASKACYLALFVMGGTFYMPSRMAACG